MTKGQLSLSQLTTPCCLIDMDKMQRNIARMSAHIGKLGCTLRPHVKTHKSIEVTKAIFAGGHCQGITVSTLKEAQYFFAHGFNDILYAVGIVPNKLALAADLIQQGCQLTLILDNPDMARKVIDAASHLDCVFPFAIEIDTDDHRAGISASSAELLDTAAMLHQSPHSQFAGVMTHAGGSYDCLTLEQQQQLARQERELTLLAANRLREAGFECAMVSIGSTPTALANDDLAGISEVRAGVYVFFDLVMAGLGVCHQDDIAMSVLASVIGHQQDKGWVITDAGWMAMSQDRGTHVLPVDQGYGVVQATTGNTFDNYIVRSANQEHGIIGHRHAPHALDFADFPLASLVRILPNHACSTAAQFEQYAVIQGENVIATWQKTTGW